MILNEICEVCGNPASVCVLVGYLRRIDGNWYVIPEDRIQRFDEESKVIFTFYDLGDFESEWIDYKWAKLSSLKVLMGGI